MPTNDKVRPVAVFVPAKVVFDEVSDDKFTELVSCLKQLPLEHTVFWCCQINQVVTNPADSDHRGQQQFGLYWFFTEEQINKINDFGRPYEVAENVHIFFRGQLLELIKWAVAYCPSEVAGKIGVGIEADDELRSTFARALLLSSDIWAERVYADHLALTGNLPSDRQRASPSMRIAAIETWPSSKIDKAIARGRHLFIELMPIEYPEFPSIFEQITGMSLDDYFACWIAIGLCYMPHPVVSKPDGTIEPVKPTHFALDEIAKHLQFEVQEKLKLFLAMESQTLSELRDNVWSNIREPGPETKVTRPHLKSLREKPILQQHGRGIMADLGFVSDKLSIGPLFHAASRSDLMRAKREPFPSFGKVFERYVCGMLHRMLNPQSQILTQRLFPNLWGSDKSKHRIEILDAVLDDSAPGPLSKTEMVAIQIKAQWLPDNVLLDPDSETYLKSLLARYVDPENSGIKQLSRAIKNMECGEWVPDRDLSNCRTIYPVLVVHDRYLDAPVHAEMLARKFEEILKADSVSNGMYQVGRYSVAPLTVLTMHILEKLESSLRTFDFIGFLKDYASSTPTRDQSVSQFLASSKYGQQLYSNLHLLQKGLEGLDDTRKRVFNGTDDSTR